MYYIIGSDGKKYGPVNADELRQWKAAGRADAATLVQAEGGTEWKPLGSFPEFSAARPASPPPASLSPATSPAGVNADALAAEIINKDYNVDIGACFSRAWNLLTQNLWLMVGATFVMLLIDGAIGSVPLAGGVASLMFSFIIWGGLDWMFVRLVRGERADFADAFIGFKQSFVPLLLGGLVASLLYALGCALCIAPGVYLFVSWMLFTPLLILETRLDFWPALELSRQVSGKHWWQLFGLTLVAALVGLSGLLACGIGVFVTLPLANAALIYAYEDIFGAALRKIEQPPASGAAAPPGTLA
jgi:hypothetical protein